MLCRQPPSLLVSRSVSRSVDRLDERRCAQSERRSAAERTSASRLSSQCNNPMGSIAMFYTFWDWSYTGVSRQPDAIIMTLPWLLSGRQHLMECLNYTVIRPERCNSSISSVACNDVCAITSHSPLGVARTRWNRLRRSVLTVMNSSLRSVWMHKLYIMYLIVSNNKGNLIKVISCS